MNPEAFPIRDNREEKERTKRRRRRIGLNKERRTKTKTRTRTTTSRGEAWRTIEYPNKWDISRVESREGLLSG